MGQAKKRNQAVLQNCPFCIFCGGETRASTIDHIPAKIMFDGKLRPKGLEFSACAFCNNSAKKSDLAAAWIGRIYPEPQTREQKDDFEKILKSINNNFPELLIEMKMGRGAEKIGLKKLPTDIEGGLLRASGPILNGHMNIFGIKLAMALHFETSRKIIGRQGGVSVRWFSNYEKFTGDFPDQILNEMGPSGTLSNGNRNVGSQFQYAWRVAEDGGIGMYFASFRMSFSVFMFVALDRENLLPKNGEPFQVFSPKDLRQMLLTA
jgi:hypothetical protein